jgi:hypothetical protein
VTTTIPAPTGSPAGTPPTATNLFYPPADPATGPAMANTDRLAATNDGAHILGASATTGLLSDIAVNLAPTLVNPTSNPNGTMSPSGSIVCPANGGPLTFTNAVTTTPLGTTQYPVTAQTITGVLPTAVAAATTNSVPVTAFVTYIGTGGVLPAYVPGAIQGGTGTATGSTPVVPSFAGSGTLTDIPLATSPTGVAAPTAPVAGVISTDDSTLFVGTSGDALVHLIAITGTPNITGLASAPTPLTDFKQIAPNLPCSPITAATMPGMPLPLNTPACVTSSVGSIAVPNLLVQKPRPST